MVRALVLLIALGVTACLPPPSATNAGGVRSVRPLDMFKPCTAPPRSRLPGGSCRP
jgi:hypothetical protein